MFARRQTSLKDSAPSVLQPPPQPSHLPQHAASVDEFDGGSDLSAEFVAATPPPAPQSLGAAAVPARPQAAAPQPGMSVIGRDLSILGGGLRIVSQGNLTVDGVVEGDVLGSNVIIGRHGNVTGLVHGETVVVEGRVAGKIYGLSVHLKDKAEVDADIHHKSLSLDMGASFEGKSRRHEVDDELLPDLVAAARQGSDS